MGGFQWLVFGKARDVPENNGLWRDLNLMEMLWNSRGDTKILLNSFSEAVRGRIQD